MDFAELIGRDRTTVQLWLRQGLPVLRRRGARRSHEIDVGPAVRWVLARVEATAEERVAAARANPSADAARAAKLIAEAKLAELSVAEREGGLVPADQVASRWGQMALACRERLLSLPAVLVQRGLVHADREDDVLGVVDDALRELAARGTHAERA